MNETLAILIELQNIDSEIDEADKCIVKINNEIALSENALKDRREQIENLKKEITKNNISRKEKEVDVASLEGEIRKHNMELNAVKANDAYKALVTEIENSKNSKLKIEDELLDLMESEEKLSKNVKKLLSELTSAEKEFSEKKTLLEKDLNKQKENIAKFTEERNPKLNSLSNNIADKYENVRKNKKGLAVVVIENDSCGGCHRNLPVHVIDEVMKGKNIVVCNNCLRILYQKHETTRLTPV